MNLLAIDTAGLAGGVALRKDGSLFTQMWTAGQRHSSVLWPSIESLLSDQGLALSDLTAVAASVGPGRLTGLRVGLAVAKSICMTQEIPLLASTRFAQVVAASSIPDHRLPVALLQLGKGKCGCLSFDQAGQACGSPQLLAAENFADGLQSLIGDASPCFVGDGVDANRLALETLWRDSTLAESEQGAEALLRAMVDLAVADLDAARRLNPEQAQVIYLH